MLEQHGTLPADTIAGVVFAARAQREYRSFATREFLGVAGAARAERRKAPADGQGLRYAELRFPKHPRSRSSPAVRHGHFFVELRHRANAE